MVSIVTIGLIKGIDTIEGPLTVLTFSVLLFLFSILAGLLGALTGLGGGIIVIPVLVLLFHINLHYAMGAALISVIATSSGTTAAYLREGFTNLRVGLFLETSAVTGAILGAYLISHISVKAIAVIFSLVLFFSAYLTIKQKDEADPNKASHPWSLALKLDGTYPDGHSLKHYRLQRVPLALITMGFGGLLSGLLGIGAGAVKVLVMDQFLRLPYKVATTTSNFMIGITAAASAGVYLNYGYINPAVTFPVMIGVMIGSFLGARLLTKMHNRTLRILFSLLICLIGVQMLYKVFFGVLG